MIPGDWLVVGLLALTAAIAAVALIIGARVPPAEAAPFDWERHCRVRDGLVRGADKHAHPDLPPPAAGAGHPHPDLPPLSAGEGAGGSA